MLIQVMYIYVCIYVTLEEKRYIMKYMFVFEGIFSPTSAHSDTHNRHNGDGL